MIVISCIPLAFLLLQVGCAQSSHPVKAEITTEVTKEITSQQTSDWKQLLPVKKEQGNTAKDKKTMKLTTELKTKVDPAYAQKLQSATQYVESTILPDMVKRVGNPTKVTQIKIVVEGKNSFGNIATAIENRVEINYEKTKEFGEYKLRDVLIHEVHHILATDKNVATANAEAVWPIWLDEGLSHFAMFTYAKQYGGATLSTLPTKKKIILNPIENSYLKGYEYSTAFIQYLEQKSPGTIPFFYTMKPGESFDEKFKKRFKQDPTSIWFREFLGQKESIVFEEKGKETSETKKVEQEIREIVEQYLPIYTKKQKAPQPIYLKTIFERTSQQVIFQLITPDNIHEKQIEYRELNKWLSDKMIENGAGEKIKVEDFILDEVYLPPIEG